MNMSVPIQAGWRLRVLTGTSRGHEFNLSQSQYVMGSRAPASIVIAHPSIADQHACLNVRADRVEVRPFRSGLTVLVNGKPSSSANLGSGDRIGIGDFEFQLINPSVAPRSAPASSSPVSVQWAKFLTLFTKWERWQRVGAVTFTVALTLFGLEAATSNPNLVPVTLLAMSLVAPSIVIFYLLDRYDQTGISLRTLSLTFLAGGTIGIIVTVFTAEAGGMITGGLLLAPLFAGLYEEPAKLLATSWRWKHPVYDRPMDGLILGVVSGLGFAVFESAGYGLRALLRDGHAGLLWVMVVRGLTSPFGHGLWSGIVAAAFWQSGRDLRTAVKNRQFQMAVLWAVGLHALWNAGLAPGIAISAYFSVREFRRLLANRGYRS
ncbi:hypothetical protein LBMAG52_05490 [Planctomycetia bacterium]|nr:hypothetical protein LBMAG52_05490 [Planctomycetia bacterium]